MKKERKLLVRNKSLATTILVCLILVVILLFLSSGFFGKKQDIPDKSKDSSAGGILDSGKDFQPTEKEDTGSTEQTGSVNVSSGGGGRQSSETSDTTSASSEDIDHTGMLVIKNYANDSTGGGVMKIRHSDITPEGPSSELSDNWDIKFSDFPENPNAVWLMPSSAPYGEALAVDVRPKSSTSSVYVNLSVIVTGGGSAAVSSTNYLELSWGAGNNFGNKYVTIQKIYPTTSQVYNVRTLISDSGGVITLPDLSGTYDDEQVYASFVVKFA